MAFPLWAGQITSLYFDTMAIACTAVLVRPPSSLLLSSLELSDRQVYGPQLRALFHAVQTSPAPNPLANISRPNAFPGANRTRVASISSGARVAAKRRPGGNPGANGWFI